MCVICEVSRLLDTWGFESLVDILSVFCANHKSLDVTIFQFPYRSFFMHIFWHESTVIGNSAHYVQSHRLHYIELIKLPFVIVKSCIGNLWPNFETFPIWKRHSYLIRSTQLGNGMTWCTAYISTKTNCYQLLMGKQENFLSTATDFVETCSNRAAHRIKK